MYCSWRIRFTLSLRSGEAAVQNARSPNSRPRALHHENDPKSASRPLGCALRPPTPTSCQDELFSFLIARPMIKNISLAHNKRKKVLNLQGTVLKDFSTCHSSRLKPGQNEERRVSRQGRMHLIKSLPCQKCPNDPARLKALVYGVALGMGGSASLWGSAEHANPDTISNRVLST